MIYCNDPTSPNYGRPAGLDAVEQAHVDLLNEFAERRRRYPHDCPRCGKWAYIGLNQIDCVAGCR